MSMAYENSSMAQHQPAPLPPGHMNQYDPHANPLSPTHATFPPQLYPDTDPSLQPATMPPEMPPQTPQDVKTQPQDSVVKESKSRLRKACDSCSLRKVKCDETQPCKACRGLEIPCTFARPSKRRGPPNRHADSIKRQRLESPGNSGHSRPTSPTHAAHTLASFSQQQVLSAESILPWPVLQDLINDYFTFIHPLIPLPHEPSFRDALDRREDLSNPTFLALLASMIGCLVAHFPRRPRQHLRRLQMEHLFPSSKSIVSRCHKVTVEAQSPVTFTREYTVHDAIISYLQGVTCGYTFHRESCLLYLKQCLNICSTLGLHKPESMRQKSNRSQQSRPGTNSHSVNGRQSHREDLVLRELERRTFWVLFVSMRTLQQSGATPFDFSIPPATRADPYPPLPLEIDDAYLTPLGINQQPVGSISELVGFNFNVRIFTTYENISRNELNYGVDEVFDWERQKQEIEQSLNSVKRLIEDLPVLLKIKPNLRERYSASSYPSPEMRNGAASPSQYQLDAHHGQETTMDRAHLQFEIQKANIYASQLGTRSYLVEKYWALSRTQQHLPEVTGTKLSPSLAATSLSSLTALTESNMQAERSTIIKELLLVLATIDQVNIEPNGPSFIMKARSIALFLLDPNHKDRVSNGNEIERERVEEHLVAFLGALSKLERVVPPSEHSCEEAEEAQLRAWADLRAEQERFARTGGFMSI